MFTKVINSSRMKNVRRLSHILMTLIGIFIASISSLYKKPVVLKLTTINCTYKCHLAHIRWFDTLNALLLSRLLLVDSVVKKRESFLKCEWKWTNERTHEWMNKWMECVNDRVKRMNELVINVYESKTQCKKNRSTI